MQADGGVFKGTDSGCWPILCNAKRKDGMISSFGPVQSGSNSEDQRICDDDMRGDVGVRSGRAVVAVVVLRSSRRRQTLHPIAATGQD